MKRSTRSLVETVAWGCALLGAVQLPGGVLDSVIRGEVRFAAVLAVALLAGAALLLRRSPERGWPRRGQALGAVAVAFGLAAGQAQLALVDMQHSTMEVADIGIVVPAPGQTTDCRGHPSRCHDELVNDLGLRGHLAQRGTTDGRLVALVGDSFIFGSGVGEEDTVPAAVERRLADLRPPVAVANAGVSGSSAASFPRIIHYIRQQLNPDVIVVLLKDDDLDDTDKLTRWLHFRRSFWFRMMWASNLETIYETGRQAARQWLEKKDGEALRRYLDAIATATAGARLVVIAALSPDLEPDFSAWMAAHPAVGHITAGEDPRYWEAEKIPGDGHWTESGCQTIADMVAPLVRAQLGS